MAIPSIKGVATMALCVTEPGGGSDVAGLKTTAVWHPEQQCFVVNGQKKWITNGCKADYLTVVCRVEPHHDLATHGMSLLLIKRSLSGVRANRMKTQGWLCSNTAFIDFDDVKCPSNMLLAVLVRIQVLPRKL